MRKRLSSKLLAVILTIAICATTVLGCLMTVSAAESCYSFGSAQFPSADDLSTVTLDVTITAPSNLEKGFVAGGFAVNEVEPDANDYLVLRDVTHNGSSVFLDEDGNRLSDDDYVVFNFDEAKSTASFTLTFGFSNGSATPRAEYKVQLDEIELAYNDKEYYVEDSGAGAIAKITTECKHVIAVVGEPLEVDAANNYSVYEKSVCTLCGDEFDMLQLVPTAEPLGDDTTSAGNTICWTDANRYIDQADSELEQDEEGNYLITSVSELIYVLSAGPSKTYGKTFKVADGIENIVLQKDAYAEAIMALNGYSQTKTWFKENASSLTKWVGNISTSDYDLYAFCGTFDGNGATIYGAYQVGNFGIFGILGSEATVKNVKVKNCYAESGWYLSVISQAIRNDWTYTDGNGNAVSPSVACVTFDKIEISGCYLEAQSGVNGNYNGAVGLLYGGQHQTAPSISNICIYDNQIYYVGNSEENTVAGDNTVLFGANAWNNAYCKLVDSVLVDCSVHNRISVSNGTFKNIYSTDTVDDTTNSKLTYLTKDQITGENAAANMPNLDWGSVWMYGEDGQYPYVEKEGCAPTDYWDGTTEPPIQDKNGVYIIDSAEKLAYIASNTVTGEYKVADGLKNFVMQPAGVATLSQLKSLSGYSETKAFFDGLISDGAGVKPWYGNVYNTGAAFSGTLDGNGVSVYGLYIKGIYTNTNYSSEASSENGTTNGNNWNHASGLLPIVTDGTTVKNIAVKSSHIIAGGRVGSLIGYVRTSGDGFVNIENCEVGNNFVATTNLSNVPAPGVNFAGVVLGIVEPSSTKWVGVNMTNCLVYGSYAENYHNHAAEGLLNGNSAYNGMPGTGDTKTVDGDEISAAAYPNMTLKNCIVLDVLPYPSTSNNHFKHKENFEVVYSDVTEIEFDGRLFKTQRSAVFGTGAQTAMPNLTWGTDWYCGAYGEYPVLAAFATLGVNELSTPEHQLYASNVVYNDDGSYNFNLHFVPQYEGIKATLYVGTKDISNFYKLSTPTTSSYTNVLGDDALMFTLNNMSARDIDKAWLPTIVVEGGTTVEWGRTQVVALEDYANKVIVGEAYYDSTATDEEKAKDKNVAAALLNYGIAAEAALGTGYTEGAVDVFEGRTELKIKYDQAGDSSKDETDSANWVLKVNGDGAVHRTLGYIDADIKLLDDTKENSEENPYIIENAEQLFYIVKIAGNVTKGKYYKVADGITEFRLHTKVTADTDFETAKALLAEGGTLWGYDSSAYFQGHFDGNGITVSGLRTTSNLSGLFPQVKGNVTIKNVNITNSQIITSYYAGAIVGAASLDKTDSTAPFGSLTVENCSVTNCYMESTGKDIRNGIAAIVGHTNHYTSYTPAGETSTKYYNGLTTIKNCYVELDEDNYISTCETDDEAKSNGLHGGMILYNGSNQFKAENCVVIGVKPYTTWDLTNTALNANHNVNPNYFSEIYTDAPTGKITLGGSSSGELVRDFTDKVIQLTTEELTGLNAKDNMPNLDWDTVWTTTSGYPTLINAAYETQSGRTVYWDGERTAPESTASGETAEDAIIIDTPSELAYIANAGYTATKGKYYKIADGIDSFVLQSSDHAEILTLDSSDKVRDYFSDSSKTFVNWKGVSGYQNASTADASEDAFAGHFDGNGVTIYGLYSTETNKYLGVFGEVDGNVTIENLSVKNAYISAADTNFNGAAIVGTCQNDGDSSVNTLVLKKCEVANCYFRTSRGSANNANWGILAGNLGNNLCMVENCLVYGNDAMFTNTTDSTSTYFTLIGYAYNGMGTSSYDGYYADYNVVDSSFVANTVTNTISIGTYPYRYHTFANRMCQPGCFENVYTDKPSGTSVTVGTSTVNYSSVITQITDLNTIKGDNAADIVAALNGDPIVWYTGAVGDYPGFTQAGVMPSNTQAIYNSMILDLYDDYGDSVTSFGMYATGLNLKVNPYMTFTFEFGGEYLRSRDVVVTFKSGDTVIDTVTAAEMTNKEGAGRFHLYRLKNAPVIALSTGITVSVTYNGVTTDFGTYSAEGFALMADNANKMEPCDYYANLYEAAKALLFYTDMLVARYGA